MNSAYILTNSNKSINVKVND
eukprot:UN08795